MKPFDDRSSKGFKSYLQNNWKLVLSVNDRSTFFWNGVSRLVNQIPGLIELSEKINPIVITGDFYRLALPEETNYPAGQFISEDGKKVVLFAFQTRATINNSWPWFRLQGLDASAKYKVDNNQTVSGSTLMNLGIQLRFEGDYDSQVLMIEKQ